MDGGLVTLEVFEGVAVLEWAWRSARVSRGRNCWTVRMGERRRVLIVSIRSVGGSTARGPVGYPVEPGSNMRPANV